MLVLVYKQRQSRDIYAILTCITKIEESWQSDCGKDVNILRSKFVYCAGTRSQAKQTQKADEMKKPFIGPEPTWEVGDNEECLGWRFFNKKAAHNLLRISKSKNS